MIQTLIDFLKSTLFPRPHPAPIPVRVKDSHDPRHERPRR